MEREINRLTLWNTVLKITSDENKALVETNYFDNLLSNYNDDKYCKIVSEICTSYYVEPELGKEDRTIFVKGMLFAIEVIDKFDLRKKYQNYESSQILSSVNKIYNSYLSKTKKNNSRKDKELYRKGLIIGTLLASSPMKKVVGLKKVYK